MHKKYGGGATGAFSKTPVMQYLQEYNQKEAYSLAVDKFIRSCAGYCVATYVLGIGDRHNDNIMCTKYGELFHIDFAHFLGNIMKFGLFKRETAPFVLTPDFAHVMGGEKSDDFKQFQNFCCTAYNILRKNSKFFINLFAMMLSTGIPELQKFEDLYYLREAFSIGVSDDEAAQIFRRLISESLNTKLTQLNNAIHIMAHPD